MFENPMDFRGHTFETGNLGNMPHESIRGKLVAFFVCSTIHLSQEIFIENLLGPTGENKKIPHPSG